VNEDWFAAPGLDFRRIEYSFGNSSTLSSDTELYDIFPRVDFGHFLSDQLFFLGSVGLGVFSDLDADLVDSLQFKSSAQLVWRLNPGAQILAGLRLSQDFEDVPIFPFIGLRLQDTEGRLHLSLTFPLEASASLHLDHDSEIFLRAWLEGNEYNLQPRTRYGVSGDVEVYQREQRVSLGYRRWFGRNFAISLEGGATPGSIFEIKEDNRDDFSQGDLDTAWFASLALDFRL